MKKRIKGAAVIGIAALLTVGFALFAVSCAKGGSGTAASLAKQYYDLFQKHRGENSNDFEGFIRWGIAVGSDPAHPAHDAYEKLQKKSEAFSSDEDGRAALEELGKLFGKK